MKREFRYMVVKYKDIVAYLSDGEQLRLIELVKKVDAGRREAGKPQLECVCVEADWPEYEAVWSMIAARVDGGLPWWKVVLYTLAAPIVILVYMIMHPVKVWEQAKKEWYK